jgi:hypothetical protein
MDDAKHTDDGLRSQDGPCLACSFFWLALRNLGRNVRGIRHARQVVEATHAARSANDEVDRSLQPRLPLAAASYRGWAVRSGRPPPCSQRSAGARSSMVRADHS